MVLRFPGQTSEGYHGPDRGKNIWLQWPGVSNLLRDPLGSIIYSTILFMITTEQLKSIVPGIKAGNLQAYTDLLNQYMPKYNINTTERICGFIANLAHESGSFNYVREIASGAAYEGRADLGNTQPGDGIKFRGRGWIQITGRGMYRLCSDAMFADARLLDHPEQLEEINNACESACWFWAKVKKLNSVADLPENFTHERRGVKYSRFEWICFLINGGTNGMAERKAFYERAKAVIK